MAKVKKRAAVTGVRNAKKNKKNKRKAAIRSSAPKARPAPVLRVTIRELDPQRKCGPGTSVQFLYRVDETVDGRATTHLVFFDRHGWYCEHGRTCPAVGHARKHHGQLARVS